MGRKKKPADLALPEVAGEPVPSANPLYDILKSKTHKYSVRDFAGLLGMIDEARYRSLSTRLGDYIGPNLLAAVKKRGGLAKYRTNPYVLMASANAMRLSEPTRLADFIFNNKLFAGLETSFGKSIEKLFVAEYPIGAAADKRWIDPPEKVAEAVALRPLSRQRKAQERVNSVWREIDKSCIFGDRRYMVSIKSGPNCINDTQVQGMTDAIVLRHSEWLRASRQAYGVNGVDIVVGITYGTDGTTNNKENQILVKLLEQGFMEEDRASKPGVLIDAATRSVRAYRAVGQDFWSLVGNPADPASARFVFLETLLAVAKGLSTGLKAASLADQINLKLAQLSAAFARMMFPQKDLPGWAQRELTDDELFWLGTCLSAFYDQGI
jgi:hypothetical protein